MNTVFRARVLLKPGTLPFNTVRPRLSFVTIPHIDRSVQSGNKSSLVRSFTTSMPPKQKAQNGGEMEESHQHQAGSTTHRKEDEWKHREPYRIHDDDEKFEAKWKGSCHCGKVKYSLSRDKPLASKYCHCTTCQKLHAAPFQHAAIFQKSDINFTNGIHDLGWYDPSEKSTTHHLPCKVSCSYCRSHIMDEGRNMILLFPPLIEGINTPEGREAFAPTCHMFYPSRACDYRDGKVKWAGLDNKSDLLDDDENVLIKFEEGMESKDMEEKKRKRMDDEIAKHGKLPKTD